MIQVMKPSTLRVLLVEDDNNDAILTKRAFKKAASPVPIDLSRVDTAEEALDILMDIDHVLPHVILLDLSLPGIQGLEALSRMKASERVRRIPVVVLTSSRDPIEIFTAWDRQVSGYIHKAVSTEFHTTIRHVIEWWTTNEFPND